MLMALLLPDPCDAACPPDFKLKARDLLPAVSGLVGDGDAALRDKLFEFIAVFANVSHASRDVYINAARQLIYAAYDDVPLVVDSFAGGGAIPLESLRCGCDTFASDYNPVATLALETLLIDAPRRGTELAARLRIAGLEIRQKVEGNLLKLYPADGESWTPTTYLWARTVRCESPDCGAEIPIYRLPWLAKRGASKARYFKEDDSGTCWVLLIESAPIGGPVTYRVARGIGSENERPGFELLTGTKIKGNASSVLCPCCHRTLPGTRPNPRVQEQLMSQSGGADVIFDENGNRIGGALLLAIVEREAEAHGGVRYRIPTQVDYVGVWQAQKALDEYLKTNANAAPSRIPDEMISTDEIRRISVPLYGVKTWRNVFTKRQQLVLASYADAIRDIDDPEIARSAALVLDRVVILLSAHCRWKASGESLIDMFGRHAIGMVWDFAEAVAVSNSASIFGRFLDSISQALENVSNLNLSAAEVRRLDACALSLPSEAAEVWFTDPPYYDSIPYAHLSDVFYVWLKRALGKHHPHLFQSEGKDGLTEKADECVVDRPHRLSKSKKTADYYEKKMAAACLEGRRVTSESGIGCVVFAHKTTEGWEALLQGVLSGGWAVTASWPIATELPSRLNARDTASLATSIHLVCRPRPEDTVGDWTSVYRELPGRVKEWVLRLQEEGVRGADLVFACIGPSLEIYSRYSKVVDVEDREIPLGGDPEAKEPHKRGFLAYVWEVVGRIALEQVLGVAEAEGALEEDSRLTALFLWTIQTTSGEVVNSQSEESEEPDEEESEEEDAPVSTGTESKTGGFKLIYDVTRRFAQPLGIHLEEWEGRIIETKKGVVRLLQIRERSQQLFGDAGANLVADRIEMTPRAGEQLDLFEAVGLGESLGAVPEVQPRGRGRRRNSDVGDDSLRTRREATTLDRVHAAMLLQASGRSNALRALLFAETERSNAFLRLANALSLLYPKQSEEKRLLDAMLLAVPR